MTDSKKFGAVLVFGDLGRSPRMQNHTVEITKNTDYSVYFIGYKGFFKSTMKIKCKFLESNINENILKNDRIQIIDLKNSFIESLRKLPRIFFLIYAFLRIVIQIMQLIFIFAKLKHVDFVIVQVILNSYIKFIIIVTYFQNNFSIFFFRILLQSLFYQQYGSSPGSRECFVYSICIIMGIPF